MRPGAKVRVVSITAPGGYQFTSLSDMLKNRVIGEVKSPPDAAGYVSVQFDTMPDGNWLSVHTSMLNHVRP